MANKNDPDNYREMLKPFETADAAGEALTAFFEELYVLRNKYRIADVSVIAQGSTPAGPFVWSAHIGSQMEAEGMAAWNLGRCRAEREEMMAAAMKEGTKVIRSKKGYE